MKKIILSFCLLATLTMIVSLTGCGHTDSSAPASAMQQDPNAAGRAAAQQAAAQQTAQQAAAAQAAAAHAAAAQQVPPK